MERLDNISTGKSESPGMYVYLISFVAAVGGFLFGYDLNVIAGAQIYLADYFHLDAKELGFAVGSAIIGCMMGPILGGWVCDFIGRKRSLIAASILFGVSAIWTAIPEIMTVFNIFRIVGGVGVGLASVASPMYIVEVAPARIRGRLVTMNQLAIVIGALTAIIVAYFIAENFDPRVSWRWMFGSELVPIILFVILLFLVPESPRWLAQQDRQGEALEVLTRVDGREPAEREIKATEVSLTTSEGRFAELFAPGIRVAVFVAVMVALMSQWTGWSVISFYMPTIFQKAGVAETTDAIFQSIIPNIGNLLFTIIGMILVDTVGRRPLYLVCSIAMVFSTGLLGVFLIQEVTGWPIVFAVTMCSWPHAIGFGALSWLIMSEIFPTLLRARAMMIGSFSVWLTAYLANQSAPILFEFFEDLTQSAGPTFFLFSFVSIFAFVFALKLIPETKGRLLEEIAESWTKR